VQLAESPPISVPSVHPSLPVTSAEMPLSSRVTTKSRPESPGRPSRLVSRTKKSPSLGVYPKVDGDLDSRVQVRVVRYQHMVVEPVEAERPSGQPGREGRAVPQDPVVASFGVEGVSVRAPSAEGSGRRRSRGLRPGEGLHLKVVVDGKSLRDGTCRFPASHRWRGRSRTASPYAHASHVLGVEGTHSSCSMEPA
jgi:hypothetical protein